MWGLISLVLLSSTYALSLPQVPRDLTGSVEALSAKSDEIAKIFADEYVKYMETGVESVALRHLSHELASSHSKSHFFWKNVEDLSVADQLFVCTTCRAALNVIGRNSAELLESPNAEETSKKMMLDLCDRFSIENEEVCSGLFDLNWPFISYIMQHTVIDSRSMCGMLPIHICQVKQPEFNLTLKIDPNGEEVTGPKSDLPSKGENNIRILQLTDIHYDPAYFHESLADCEEPLCCRKEAPSGTDPSRLAGYWSDYRNCDTPLHMLENALDHIKTTHEQIDYIYQTGDIIGHNIWSTKKEENIETLTIVNKLLEDKFPNIPIYSVVGNHESHPADMFGPANVPEELSTKWLYEHLYKLWSKWLPVEAKTTVEKGGYYTVSPRKGLRIISINNNECYLFNWYTFLDGRIVVDQLQWLHDVLLDAEKANEKVHILAHIPTGSADCNAIWGREYNRIVQRFRNTISAMYNGHTHKDEMRVHYSDNGHAIGIAWNGGSFTAFARKNPNYRFYDVEPETLQVVDHETWIFNITEANLNGKDQSPNWYQSYQFSEEFTSDLSPAGIDQLLDEMAENPEILRKYWRHKMTLADPVLEEGCDDECLMSNICKLAITVHDQKQRCRELQTKLQLNLNSGTTAKPTEKPTEKPGGGGAAGLTVLKMTSLIGLFFLLKVFLV